MINILMVVFQALTIRKGAMKMTRRKERRKSGREKRKNADVMMLRRTPYKSKV